MRLAAGAATLACAAANALTPPLLPPHQTDPQPSFQADTHCECTLLSQAPFTFAG